MNCLSLVVAGWIQCLSGPSGSGAAIEVDDLAAPILTKLAAEHPDAFDLAQAVAQDTPYLGGLSKRPEFLLTLGESLTALRRPAAARGGFLQP